MGLFFGTACAKNSSFRFHMSVANSRLSRVPCS
jgi:hypothetical protein